MKLCASDSAVLLATPNRLVDINDAASCHPATAWCTDKTSIGDEGMVVKPLDFISIKGRVTEYL